MAPDMIAVTSVPSAPASLASLRWETRAGPAAASCTIVFGRRTSPNFGTGTDVFFIGLNIGEIAIMALPLTLIVITGEIDLSVASMLGLSSTLLGLPVRARLVDLDGHAVVLVVGAARRRAQRVARHQGRACRRSPSRSAR